MIIQCVLIILPVRGDAAADDAIAVSMRASISFAFASSGELLVDLLARSTGYCRPGNCSTTQSQGTVSQLREFLIDREQLRQHLVAFFT
jgi:hypothetical protein